MKIVPGDLSVNRWTCLLLLVCISSAVHCEAQDDRHSALSIEAVATGVYQQGYFDGAVDENGGAISDTGSGSFALDVQAEISPGRRDSFYALASLARGNGLKNTGGVSLTPNADDLEDDVENINDRDRDYLLEAWYRRHLIDDKRISVALTGGLIDATRYLDHNRVANDEVTQFMNEAFVTRFFLPSYDPGIAIQTKGRNWHLDMTWMHTQTGSDDNGGTDYDFFGADLGYAVTLPFGEGNYHLIAQTTSRDFEHRNKTGRQTSVHGLTLSVDQTVAAGLDLFLRAGASNNDATELVHDTLYSAGFQLDGHRVSVPGLVVGVACAYLDGAGNQRGDVRHTRVFETYARYILTRFIDISADVQWVSDTVREEPNPRLWVIGTRLNLYF